MTLLRRMGSCYQPICKECRTARRSVVERTLSWQNDFRSLRVRWAKRADNWLAFIQLASALVLWNMTTRS